MKINVQYQPSILVLSVSGTVTINDFALAARLILENKRRNNPIEAARQDFWSKQMTKSYANITKPVAQDCGEK